MSNQFNNDHNHHLNNHQQHHHHHHHHQQQQQQQQEQHEYNENENNNIINNEERTNKQLTCGLQTSFIVSILVVQNIFLLLTGIILLILTLFDGWPASLTNYHYTQIKLLRSILPIEYPFNLIYLTLIVISSYIIITGLITLIYNIYYLYIRKNKHDDITHNEIIHEDSNELDEITLNIITMRPKIDRNGKIFYDHDDDDEDNNLNDVNRVNTELTIKRKKLFSSIIIRFLIFSLLLLFTIQISLSIYTFLLSFPYIFDEETIVNQNGHNNSQQQSDIYNVNNLNGNTVNEIHFIKQLRDYNKKPNATINELIKINRVKFDEIERSFKCCGIVSYEDYTIKENVADTCCITYKSNCGLRRHPSNIYLDGCGNKVMKIYSEHFLFLGSIAFILSFIHLFGLLFSSCLYVQMVKEANYYHRH